MMKFKSYQLWFFIIAIIAIGIMVGSCSSSTDPYQPFVADGEIEYSQKPDTVIALSGKNRVVLKLVRPASPLAKKAGIFWNSGNDSLMADFPENQDTLEVSIPGLDREGSYSFDVYTYNKDGEHKSVATTLSVTVYGDIFASSITSRELNYIEEKGNNTIVHWNSNPEGAIGTVLKYTNQSNEPDSTVVPPDSSTTTIPLAEDAETISYYSLYQPGASIDTFQAPGSSADVEASTGFVIYNDKPHEGWATTADGTLDTMNTDHVYSGKYSTKTTFGGRFVYLFFNAPETIDISEYSKYLVSVYAEDDYQGGGLRILIRNNTSGYGDHRYEIFDVPNNEWTTETVLFSEIGNPTEITQFGLQSHQDNGAGTVYIDEVVLLK